MDCRGVANRRSVLQGMGALLGATGIARPARRAHAAKRAPSSPVGVARATSYELDALMPRLATVVDSLGGLKKLVAGKTVAVKVNMVSKPRNGALGLPSGRTYQVHFNVAYGLATLLDQAGARRIRFLESSFDLAPIEDFFKDGGWDLAALAALKAKVEFEDTRNLGRGKKYHRVKVPWGGSLFPAYDLNHSYVDCDVYVSLAKLKNHRNAGVTLSMKNNFGITPTSLYGGSKHDESCTDNRGPVLHFGTEAPPAGVPRELVARDTPRDAAYRVPRHTVDSVGIRPIDLALIDGIETVSAGEGPWHKGLKRQVASVLVAGRNPVCTDAVATAIMGYDPLAARATGPFPGDNHLAMAHALGIGSADVAAIDVRGPAIEDVLHPFGWEPKRG